MFDKIFRIVATILTVIFALTGIAITIAGWIVPNWVIELRIAATLFGIVFLTIPNILILIMTWID